MTLHLEPLMFPHLLALGGITAWMRMRSGSLYPGMLMHFVHNTLVIVVEHVLR